MIYVFSQLYDLGDTILKVLISFRLFLMERDLSSFLCSSTKTRERGSFLYPKAVQPTISVNIIATSLRSLWDTTSLHLR